jgi:hypothetical protein
MLRLPRVLWLSLLVAPGAWAQPAGVAATGSNTAPSGTEAALPTAGASLQPNQPVQHAPTISGPQMLAQGQEYRKQVETIKKLIRAQVEQGKKDKDLIRLNCLLDKATQVDVNGNMMDQTLQILQEKVSSRDESGQLHEYTRITIIHQKVEVLRSEADGCVGAETNYVGPTKVVVEIPGGLPEGVDQPPPPTPPFTGIDRPVASSPFTSN